MSEVTFKEMNAALDALPMPKFVKVTVEMRDGEHDTYIYQFGGGFDEASLRLGAVSQARNEVPYGASKAAMTILKNIAFRRVKKAKGETSVNQ